MHASLVRKVNIGTSQKVVFSYNIKAPQTIQKFIFHTNIDWSNGKTPNNSNRYQMPTHNNLLLNYWRGTQFRRFAENDPLIIIGFNHGVLGLAENPARGTGFWSQNTEGVARGVLTEKARPSTPWLKPIIACSFIVIQPLLSSNY